MSGVQPRSFAREWLSVILDHPLSPRLLDLNQAFEAILGRSMVVMLTIDYFDELSSQVLVLIKRNALLIFLTGVHLIALSKTGQKT